MWNFKCYDTELVSAKTASGYTRKHTDMLWWLKQAKAFICPRSTCLSLRTHSIALSVQGLHGSSVTSPRAKAPSLRISTVQPGLAPVKSKRENVEVQRLEAKGLPLQGLGLLTSHWSEPGHMATPSCKGGWEVRFSFYLLIEESDTGNQNPRSSISD